MSAAQLHPTIARSMAWFIPQREPDYGAAIQSDCAAEWDRRDREAKTFEAAKASLTDDFLRAAMAGDMNAPARFAPMVPDYSLTHADVVPPKRYQTIYEVMKDACDDAEGKVLPALFDLLGKAAAGEDVGKTAAQILTGIGAGWAEANVGEVLA